MKTMKLPLASSLLCAALAMPVVYADSPCEPGSLPGIQITPGRGRIF